MNNNEILKKVLDHNRDVFENTYKALDVVQDRGQKLTEQAIENTGILPEEFKDINRKWFEALNRVRENVREAVIRGHEQVEKYVNPA